MPFIMLHNVSETGQPERIINTDHVVMMRPGEDGGTDIILVRCGQGTIGFITVVESIQDVFARMRKE